MTGSTLKLSEPEKLRKLKEEMPHEFQFRRDMAEAAYLQCKAEGKSEQVVNYMRELMEFYDGL